MLCWINFLKSSGATNKNSFYVIPSLYNKQPKKQAIYNLYINLLIEGSRKTIVIISLLNHKFVPAKIKKYHEKQSAHIDSDPTADYRLWHTTEILHPIFE